MTMSMSKCKTGAAHIHQQKHAGIRDNALHAADAAQACKQKLPPQRTVLAHPGFRGLCDAQSGHRRLLNESRKAEQHALSHGLGV